MAIMSATSQPLLQLLLKGWLRDRWALLFSHPDDFASYGFEADRWIEQVRATFDGEAITALAVGAESSCEGGNWIEAVGGRLISHRMLDGIATLSDWPRRDATDRRFVMILDGALELQRTFFYTSTARVPSPIDLAVMAANCRCRASAGVVSMQRQIA
ncbi:MAG: hypothetical protein ABW171_05080 [Steroidobacter sp.]